MPNTPPEQKSTPAQIHARMVYAKKNMFERYFECPACGNEPFPEVILEPRQKAVKPVGYFCPKCFAISLQVAVRVRKEYLPKLEAAGNTGHRNGQQKAIEAMEDRELSAYQRMKAILDPGKIYNKVRNTIARSQKRQKGLSVC